MRSLAAAKKTVELLGKGSAAEAVTLSPREKKWLGKIGKDLDEIPEDRGRFIRAERDRWRGIVAFEEYELGTS